MSGIVTPPATIDSKLVILTFFGQPIFGFAKGTKVKLDFAEDWWKKEVGSDGFTTWAKTNDTSGNVEITLSQGSPSNDMLSAILIADYASNGGLGPFGLADLSGTSVSFASYARIRKPPSQEWGEEAKTRVWTLDFASCIPFVGGNFNPLDLAAETAALLASLGA